MAKKAAHIFKSKFVHLIDVAENVVAVCKDDVAAFGESDSEKYASWLLLKNVAAPDHKLLLKNPVPQLSELFC